MSRSFPHVFLALSNSFTTDFILTLLQTWRLRRIGKEKEGLKISFLFGLYYRIYLNWAKSLKNYAKLLKSRYIILKITQMCLFTMPLIFLTAHRILIFKSKYSQKKNLNRYTLIINLPSVFPYRNYILTPWRHCKPLFLFCLENNIQCDPDYHLVFQLLMWFWQ